MLLHAKFDDLKEVLLAGASLRPFAGQHLMVAWVEAREGVVVPPHRHEHEQMVVMLQGRLRMRMGEDWFEVGPKEVLFIPSNTEHEAVVVQDATYLDVFHPVRLDLLPPTEELP